MFAGTDLIIACPHCQALAKLSLPEAAEVPGMVTWTDGWQTMPGLERPPKPRQRPRPNRPNRRTPAPAAG